MKPIDLTIKLVTAAVTLKSKTDLLVVKMANHKSFKTLQSIIVSLAN